MYNFFYLPFSPRCPYETASKQTQMERHFLTKSSQTSFRCQSCNKLKFGISRKRNAISQAEECRGLFLKLVIIYTELYFSLSLPTKVYLTFLILGTEYYAKSLSELFLQLCDMETRRWNSLLCLEFRISFFVNLYFCLPETIAVDHLIFYDFEVTVSKSLIFG